MKETHVELLEIIEIKMKPCGHSTTWLRFDSSGKLFSKKRFYFLHN